MESLGTEWYFAIILSGAGALSAAWTLYTNIKDRGKTVQKQDGEIKLDKETQNHIAAEAAKINSDERIETERWWKEQFDAVKDELVEEQEWRRRVSKYIRQHQPWDRLAQEKLVAAGIDMPPPPTLDAEEKEHG